MSRFWKMAYLVVCALVLMACATVPISRIEEHRQVYESWPIEIRQLVLDGTVVAGMSMDMVYLAWGVPDKRLSAALLGEVWIYGGGDTGLPERAVVFRAGHVQSVEARRR